MNSNRWTLQVQGEAIEVMRADGLTAAFGGRRVPAPEAAWLVETLGFGGPNDARLRADLQRLVELVRGGPSARPMRLQDLSSTVAEAVRREQLVVLRTFGVTAVEQHVKVEPLGWDETPEVLEDVFVLAAEVKLIGDTLLKNHPVRIFDPDTGEVVVEWTETNDKGVVRARVPKQKDYRIEIMDFDGEQAQPPLAPNEEQPILLCRFVDELGQPVAELDVASTGEDGVEKSLRTDAEGRIAVPASTLGPLLLKISSEGGDQTFDAHTQLLRDLDDEGAEYRFVVAHRHADEPRADTPTLRLTRIDDDGFSGFDEGWVPLDLASAVDEVA